MIDLIMFRYTKTDFPNYRYDTHMTNFRKSVNCYTIYNPTSDIRRLHHIIKFYYYHFVLKCTFPKAPTRPINCQNTMVT